MVDPDDKTNIALLKTLFGVEQFLRLLQEKEANLKLVIREMHLTYRSHLRYTEEFTSILEMPPNLFNYIMTLMNGRKVQIEQKIRKERAKLKALLVVKKSLVDLQSKWPLTVVAKTLTLAQYASWRKAKSSHYNLHIAGGLRDWCWLGWKRFCVTRVKCVSYDISFCWGVMMVKESISPFMAFGGIEACAHTWFTKSVDCH